jgi:hypothetical protein
MWVLLLCSVVEWNSDESHCERCSDRFHFRKGYACNKVLQYILLQLNERHKAMPGVNYENRIVDGK